jgi:hypothetical protein
MNLASFTRFTPLLLLAIAGCSVDPATHSSAPTLQYGRGGSGCSNIFVYAENIARTEVLVIQADRDSLALTTTPRTFTIEQNPAGLDLHIDLFDAPHDGNRYCSDIGTLNRPISQWSATRGRVEISVSTNDPSFNTPYQTTIRLYDVVFTNPQTGSTVTLPSLTLENVTVGWLPG